MLATLQQLLLNAEAHRYAVIAPDFPSLYVARVLIETAESLKAPLALSYATMFKPICDLRSYARFIQVVRDECQAASVPMALHLDHATDLQDIREAVELGFTSVMMDASAEPYEVNLERTCRAVEIANPAGVSVEAELGHVASGADYLVEDQTRGWLTDPAAAAGFVQTTQIDALAVAIGTVHGLHRGEPRLDLELLQELKKTVPVPLVLHGASGLGDDTLQSVTALGICKINVYSEIIHRYLQTTRSSLEQSDVNPIAVRQAQATGIREVLSRYLHSAGSVGRAQQVKP